MKIDNSMKPVGVASATDTRARPAQAATPGAAAAGDKVELSALSGSLKQAEAKIASTPEVNRARVDEIRQAISEGRFKVDASRIADGLITSVREMLATQPNRP